MAEIKSIWHKPSEKPTEQKTIFAQHKSLRDNTIECFMWEIQELTDAICKDIIAWCYLDDLLALETELDHTRKTLDVTVEVLKEVDEILSLNKFNIKEVPLLNITQRKISMLLKCINLEQRTALTKGGDNE